MSVATARPSTAAGRLREDAVHGWEYLRFTALLGSALVPRVVRRFLLNAAGAHVESGPGARFSLRGTPRNLTIGPGVYCNTEVTIEAIAPVTIGANAAIGMQVLIATSHHALDDPSDTERLGHWTEAPSGRPVSIGERVWIGGRAVILPGAVIDDDVVVAAGAVVSGHLRSHGVYGGVPAKRIRELEVPA
ncbi:DapH/DapD/GlmU-related protein [Curtobacterium sp. ISL-83]|uniref:acyltransferase n=1 Tax=Curtobacterium sp. ISL-83 TaxID=2819145 RepID=UPI001BEB33A6|nr:DapH/DapD/GlmU-related protein [Curtobacterium sp. ISL-83]MBT2503853.1 hypothetical protein [Curtobacterium sp. ISL-83]